MVPKARYIVPGTGVNIVLKADQPSGRLTTGIVRDVLTRADHPRGVKVRLTDNQIGRVRSLVSETASGGGPKPGEDSNDPEMAEGMLGWDRGRGRGGIARHDGRRGRTTGPRQQQDQDECDGGVERGTQALGLDAFIVSSNRRRHGGLKGMDDDGADAAIPQDLGGAASQQRLAATGADDALVCPVCGGFAGDEPAVAHHVAEHFD